MFALLSVLRVDKHLRFGDMSNRMPQGTGSDTGADAEQFSKGFLLCFFSFVRKKRAFFAHGAKMRREKLSRRKKEHLDNGALNII